MNAADKIDAAPAGVRRGLVLGAGGLLGFAWMVAALHALQDVEGFDAREVDVTVGTSAGSILAALLGVGVGVDVMLRHQLGTPGPDDPPISYSYDADRQAGTPSRPAWRVGSVNLLLHAARHPLSVPPLAAVSAALPPGRGSLAPVGAMIDGVLRASAQANPAAVTGVDTSIWPVQPRTWIPVLDYRWGRRVVFGREGAPPAPLAAAVMASCAIPGWYAPIVISGHRYVDGGTSSPTSLDLLAGAGLDEVWVLAPMMSFAYDRPSTLLGRMERRYRRVVTRRVISEAGLVRESGTRVTLLGPGPEDLHAMGANLMNPRRRASVLRTALRTSAEALRRPAGQGSVAAGG